MKLGFQYGCVISPLLFVVVSSESRSGLPSELLYASDLVLMVPTTEQPVRRVADWRVSLLNKGLNVNSGRSKGMVGSSDGKMIINSEKRPCGVVVCLTRPMEGKGGGLTPIFSSLGNCHFDNTQLESLEHLIVHFHYFSMCLTSLTGSTDDITVSITF